jgi:hypothetical protein
MMATTFRRVGSLLIHQSPFLTTRPLVGPASSRDRRFLPARAATSGNGYTQGDIPLIRVNPARRSRAGRKNNTRADL